MPRERVDAVTDPWQPVVGWSHDRGVQVATVSEGERSIYWLLLGADVESLQRLGRQIVVVAEAIPDKPGPADHEEAARNLLNTLDVFVPSTGLWSDLSRRGVNDLIRVLRRARDAAFGRDE